MASETIRAHINYLESEPNRPQQVRNALARYEAQKNLQANPDPVVNEMQAGKYSVHPGMSISMYFGDATSDPNAVTDADEAWTTFSELSLGWVQSGSWMEQYTGPDAASKHRIEWQDDGSGGVNRVVIA